MTDTPYDNNNNRKNEELARPSVDILEGDGGSSSGRQTGKMSALRNFFRQNFSNKDAVTPRNGSTSAQTVSSAHHTSVSGEDNFDDHMVGSVYQRMDICKACGFPRGSSVCCPVTRRHHGTDEATPPSKHHSRSASGGMNIMAKIRGKLPLTPGHRSNRHGSDDGKGEGGDEPHTPPTGELPPLTLTTIPGTYGEGTADDRAAKDAPLFQNHTMGPPSPEIDGENGESNNENVNANLDAYASGDSPMEEAGCEEEVQYYCYTDENGDTYYYTQKLLESVQDVTQAPHHSSHVEGEEASTAVADAAGADAAGDLPQGAYVYQYVDERGATVSCLCTPPGGEESPAVGQGGDVVEEELGDPTTPTTSAVAHAGSDTANSETDDTSANHKKSSGAFFTTIQNIFRPHRGSHTHSSEHKDPLNMHDTDTPAAITTITPPSGAGLDGTANGHAAPTLGCVETHEYDDAVATFMQLLDASEKKKFLKERKNLIKKLESSEKRERETIMKNRQDGMTAFTRDKLAASFAIRKDERTIKTGQKRSEPL